MDRIGQNRTGYRIGGWGMVDYGSRRMKWSIASENFSFLGLSLSTFVNDGPIGSRLKNGRMWSREKDEGEMSASQINLLLAYCSTIC